MLCMCVLGVGGGVEIIDRKTCGYSRSVGRFYSDC